MSRDRSHLLMKRLVKIYASAKQAGWLKLIKHRGMTASLYCNMVAMKGRHVLTNELFSFSFLWIQASLPWSQKFKRPKDRAKTKAIPKNLSSTSYSSLKYTIVFTIKTSLCLFCGKVLSLFSCIYVNTDKKVI